MPSIADILTTRSPIGGNRRGPTAPTNRPPVPRLTREGAEAKLGPDRSQWPGAGDGPNWWDPTDPNTPRQPIGTKAPPDDDRVTHPPEAPPPPGPDSGHNPPKAGPDSPDAPDTPGEPPPANEFPFDFGKGFEGSEQYPDGSDYAPGTEPIPTFEDSPYQAKLGPDEQQNSVNWASTLGLLPEGMQLSSADGGGGYPMLGGGSAGPWSQAGVNAATGTSGAPKFAVVGGQGGYGLGQVGPRYTGPLWNTPPGQTPPITQKNPSIAKPLSALGLPSWLLDPNLLGNPGAGGGGGGGGGGGKEGPETPPETPPEGEGKGGPATPDPAAAAPAPAPAPEPPPGQGMQPPVAGAARNPVTPEQAALGWKAMAFVQPRMTPPQGYAVASDADMMTAQKEAMTLSQQMYGDHWGRPANISRAYREVLDKKKLWNKRIEQNFEAEINRGVLPAYRDSTFNPELHPGANPDFVPTDNVARKPGVPAPAPPPPPAPPPRNTKGGPDTPVRPGGNGKGGPSV